MFEDIAVAIGASGLDLEGVESGVEDGRLIKGIFSGSAMPDAYSCIREGEVTGVFINGDCEIDVVAGINANDIAIVRRLQCQQLALIVKSSCIGGVEPAADPVCREKKGIGDAIGVVGCCLLYTSPSPRDVEESRMPSSA